MSGSLNRSNMHNIKCIFLVGLMCFATWAQAEADLDVATPAISALKNSMQARHAQLAAHFASGAVGLTKDGLIALRDITAVPLKDRQGINALVAAENDDRVALYKEIAAGNGHPDEAGADSFVRHDLRRHDAA